MKRATCLFVLANLVGNRPKYAVAALLALSAALATASGAPDDSPQALMREAFPGWGPEKMTTITAPGTDGQPQRVTVAPELVLPLDDSHRALVVSGVRVIDTGMRMQSHGAPANLGVYVFERRDGRWAQTNATPSAGWAGFFGKPGQLRRVELGGGHVGLAVENGECWQGFCGQWLTLFDVTPDGTRQLLHLRMGSESLAATEPCMDWLKGRLRTVPEHYDARLCFDVASRWQLETVPDQDLADVVVRFMGREAGVNARTGAPVVRAVRETLVLRLQEGRYGIVSGRNPTHDF